LTTQKLLTIAAAIAVASFLLGRLSAADDLIDGSATRFGVATFSGGAIGMDDARDVLPDARPGSTRRPPSRPSCARACSLASRRTEAPRQRSFLARYSEELAGLYVAETFEALPEEAPDR
jgi:hypothetical protein